MKKAFALFLCVALLLVMPIGCKKKDTNKTGELTNSQISSDVIDSRSQYPFAHIGTINSVANLKIVEKNESDDTISLKVTATALAPSAKIALAADMKYVAKNGAWDLDSIKVTKAVPTLIDGPDRDSVLMEIDNYISNNPTSREQNKNIALAVKGEEHHNLEINVVGVTWEMKYDAKTKTAKLHASQKTNKLTFSGYYSLTFDEKKGWVIETEKQDNGFYYPVLHLDTLEQNAPTTKK